MKIIDRAQQKGGYYDRADEIKLAIEKCLAMPNCPGFITAEKLRADNNKTDIEWPQGYIEQAARDMGHLVEGVL